jgi:hypothetical protein
MQISLIAPQCVKTTFIISITINYHFEYINSYFEYH